MKNIGIIGGGAAGYFAAINIMEMMPQCSVTIYEKATRPLIKVGVSGGGRCNLTNSFEGVSKLQDAYPRGHKLIKQLFRIFDNKSAVEWFEARGVALTLQDDHCYFPKSQDSAEIINTFRALCKKYGIEERFGSKVSTIKYLESNSYELCFDDSLKTARHDAVIVTTGGSPTQRGISFLNGLNLEIVEPVPSLFTFNIPNSALRERMGSVVSEVQLALRGTKFRSSGIMLVTHWGVSGPVVLKLSSYSARFLQENNYRATLVVNWVNERNEEVLRGELSEMLEANRGRLVGNLSPCPWGLPRSVWEMLLERAGISMERRCGEVGSKGFNRLISILSADEYAVEGKSKFREEFVTCGGVALSNISTPTMESKEYAGLYFAGEVLDVDAITGGFNLQAAWSMGYAIAQALHTKKSE